MVDRAEAVGRIALGCLLGLACLLLLPRRILEIGAGTKRTDARISMSRSNSSSASAIWLISEMSKKLSGGLRISMVPTCPTFSTPISL
jgi:hypothetical protein